MTNKYPKAVSQSTLSKPQLAVEDEETQKNGWERVGSGILDFLAKIAIPVAIPLTVLSGTHWINEANQEIARENRIQDRKIADDQANQKTLDQYVEDLSKLLFDRKLRNAKAGDEVYKVARARTLSVLPSLDGKRKVQLISFLNEVKLFEREKEMLSLREADLSGVNFYGMDLNGIDLTKAKLSGALLKGANLKGARLNGVDLNGADLNGVDLNGVDLTQAKLTGAKLTGAKLNGATLNKAVFKDVGLRGLDFRGVNLTGADFSLAKWDLDHDVISSDGGSGQVISFYTAKALDADFTEVDLKGAIMPDSPKHAHLCRTKMPDGTTNSRDCSPPLSSGASFKIP